MNRKQVFSDLTIILRKYGEIALIVMGAEEIEMKITTGFSGKAKDTFDLMLEINMILTAHKFIWVKALTTEKDLFHYTLTKTKKK